MIFVFDTTVFVADFWMRGIQFTVFWEGLPRLDAAVRVPHVVVDETINKFAETVTERWNEARRALSKAERLLGQAVGGVCSEGERDALINGFAESFRETLDDRGIVIVDYPEIGHRDLAKKALSRRKPFNKRGAGYRDALIWESVLQLAEAGDDHVVFVTGNTDDFADGDNARLHADLLAELAAGGIDADRVPLLTSLQAVNEKFIKPKLAHLDALADALDDGSHPKFDVTDWLFDNLASALNPFDVELNLVAHDLPPDCGSVMVSAVKDIVQSEVEDLRELPSGRFLAVVSTVAKLGTTVGLSSDDYWRHSEAQELLGNGDHHGVWDATIPIDAEIGVRLELILDQHVATCEAAEVVELSGDHGSINVQSDGSVIVLD